MRKTASAVQWTLVTAQALLPRLVAVAVVLVISSCDIVYKCSSIVVQRVSSWQFLV
jgi:hypothetical protein